MNDSNYQSTVVIILVCIGIMLGIDSYTTLQIAKIKPATTIASTTNNFISLPAPLKCRITFYSNQICETDNDPEHTATMQHPVEGKTCAVSPDLFRWLGGQIYIEGIGIRKVNDLTNNKLSQTIDIYVTDPKQKNKFNGVRLVTFLGR